MQRQLEKAGVEVVTLPPEIYSQLVPEETSSEEDEIDRLLSELDAKFNGPAVPATPLTSLPPKVSYWLFFLLEALFFRLLHSQFLFFFITHQCVQDALGRALYDCPCVPLE